MKKSNNKIQLKYLLSLSKTNPPEICYLWDLYSPPAAVKSVTFLNVRQGFVTILDIASESLHLQSEITYTEN